MSMEFLLELPSKLYKKRVQYLIVMAIYLLLAFKIQTRISQLLTCYFTNLSQMCFGVIIFAEIHIQFLQILESAIQRENPKVNRGLRVMLMCQCGFINVHNKCNKDVDNGGSYTCEGEVL